VDRDLAIEAAEDLGARYRARYSSEQPKPSENGEQPKPPRNGEQPKPPESDGPPPKSFADPGDLRRAPRWLPGTR
jgi:hypothetical protein